MFDSHIHPDEWGILPFINVFGVEISSYALFILMGIFAAFIYYKYDTRHLDEDLSSNALLIAASALIVGTIGAKIPSAIELYSHNPGQNLTYYFLESGRTIIGGLVGGFIGVKVIKRVLGIKERRGNQLAPAIALGMVFGRLACFLRGCCYGIESRVGVDFGDHLLRHPTQLYEAFFHVLAFLVLHRIHKKDFKPGILLKYYFMSYFAFRFIIEFIRVNPLLEVGLSGYQVASGVLFILMGLQMVVSMRREGKYER
jgi:phosphatidylglycerol:prolipoprotein diacylglycerol transferase